ncbi:GNAT family N-acetyltransferase [Pedobacter petrophilus]|uniref:GNAT family N-acetyltransferase n=1 Tax=Pedobacter petrophilus TaxID=1908241 RepID=A0A7K0G1E0_9SPHI|nr:GNAT family protein [Pedobacter petrophilus]MRX77164.1 GNAT family N-acetyltransferase [Pedobacter petrophilus]
MQEQLNFQIDHNIHLELTHHTHAEGLFRSVDENRDHISKFLSWVDHMKTVEDTRNYIKTCTQLFNEGKEVSFVIIYAGKIAGRVGLHHINNLDKNAAIGYWLTEEAIGKGIIINSCKKLINYGFDVLGLNRIEIKVATQNFKSQAVPEKLNFVKEGILRQAAIMNNDFLDLILYSALKKEWVNK